MIKKPDFKSRAAGIGLAAFSVFIWGITFVCTKSLLRDFSALEILVFRFLMAYAGLWILCPHVLHIADRKQELVFAAAGLSGVTLYQFLENMAILYTSASNVSIIVSICPIFTAIIAQLFLHEKHVTPLFVAGFIIAITGIALVSFNGQVQFHFSPKGDFMALGAAVSWGFYSLFVSKINTMGYRNLACTRRVFFYALIFMIPLTAAGLFIPEIHARPEMAVDLSISLNAERFAKPMNWINLGFLGLAASAFCFAAWNKACDILGTVYATVGIYLIPVVTIIFAFFALGEKITVMGLAGAACTITGLVISGIKTKA